jgi:hypothetical protein
MSNVRRRARDAARGRAFVRNIRLMLIGRIISEI